MSSANAAQAKPLVASGQGHTNSFLTGIVTGNAGAGWAARSTWNDVFRSGTLSFFGAELVSLAPYTATTGGSVRLQGSSAPIVITSPKGETLSGGVLKLGAGTLQFGTNNAVTVSVAGSGNLTVSENVLTSGTIDVSTQEVAQTSVSTTQSVPAETAAATAAPPRPGVRPKPPVPPGPPAVSR